MGTFDARIARRAVAAGAALAAALVLGGDGPALSSALAGIDPLQILDGQTKPNVLLVLDSSSSMSWTPEGTHLVGGDDPASRFYQAKTALLDAIAANGPKMNIGLASFGPDTEGKPLTAAGPLVYVSEDADAERFLGFFDDISSTFAEYDGTSASEVFRSFGNRESDNGFDEPYPVGCKIKAKRCRSYLKSRLYRTGVIYRWRVDGRPATVAPFTEPVACPLPPAGLTPDNPDLDLDGKGDEPRPCIALQSVEVDDRGRERKPGNSRRAFYYLASGVFVSDTRADEGGDDGDDWDGDEAAGSTGCTARHLEDVPACTLGTGARIEVPLGTEIVYGATGAPAGVPAATELVGRVPSPAGAGLRLGAPRDATPIAASLAAALGHFNGVVFPQRPPALAGRQLNFAVVVTDGRESCAGRAAALAAARALFDNLPSPANRVETIVVAFTPDADVAFANELARAGSGGVRDAFQARNYGELEGAIDEALRAALAQMVADGTFSDQQSVTESVYEMVSTLPAPAPPAVAYDPMDPRTRYQATVPVLLQSTFEMPGFRGRLKAFRNAEGTSFEHWDAGQKLYERVVTTGLGSGQWTFAQLHAGATPQTVATSGARIRRRILTTRRNGVFTPAVADVLARTPQPDVVALWPPAPGVAALDDALEISYPELASDVLRFSALQDEFGACVGGNLPAGCTDASAATRFAAARQEAREMILAHTAGAEVVRDGRGDPLRGADRLIRYRARSWVMAESTLAAPAVVAPPLDAKPTFRTQEYVLYRDGLRSGGTAVNGIAQGFGLRNPDRDNQPASRLDPALKPVMSVVYHAANDMLHAFRAGPCPAEVATCGGETGGEELWAYVPFDLLPKLKERMKPQGREPHTYMLAAPVRFADVFLPGPFNVTIGGATASGDGVWRTVLFFGRGIGGKHVTALDVTVPGPFTVHSLATNLPLVYWNRGNPDTSDGFAKDAGNTYNNTTSAGPSDYAAYARMGQTWSVPAVGFVNASANVTARNPTGVDFVLYMGSGYGDGPNATNEGSTFYVLDALTGDVVAAHDTDLIAPAASPHFGKNALVSSPAVYAGPQVSAGFVGHPASQRATAVYFPDLLGRLWRVPTTAATPPAVWADLRADGDQPLATGLAVLHFDSDGAGPRAHVYAEAGQDRRVPLRSASPRFRMYGVRDEGWSVPPTVLFGTDFPDGYRGTTQPAVAFNAQGKARVFFAGTSFTEGGCLPRFDSVVYALNGGNGTAAYDLHASGDDRSVVMAGQRVNAIRVAGGRLVVDSGLEAQNAPPPPAPPEEMPVPPGAQMSEVFLRDARLGIPVCR